MFLYNRIFLGPILKIQQYSLSIKMSLPNVDEKKIAYLESLITTIRDSTDEEFIVIRDTLLTKYNDSLAKTIELSMSPIVVEVVKTDPKTGLPIENPVYPDDYDYVTQNPSAKDCTKDIFICIMITSLQKLLLAHWFDAVVA